MLAAAGVPVLAFLHHARDTQTRMTPCWYIGPVLHEAVTHFREQMGREDTGNMWKHRLFLQAYIQLLIEIDGIEGLPQAEVDDWIGELFGSSTFSSLESLLTEVNTLLGLRGAVPSPQSGDDEYIALYLRGYGKHHPWLFDGPPEFNAPIIPKVDVGYRETMLNVASTTYIETCDLVLDVERLIFNVIARSAKMPFG